MKRILIVEDQTDIRELIRMSLESTDFEIHEAEDGEAAIQLTRQLNPDLLLLDVMMPGALDGLAVCQRLKGDPAHRRTRIVMLSARSGQADRQAGLRAGADDYLV